MNEKKKGKYIGWIGALIVHGAFVVFLLLAGFTVPRPQEEEGMPVLLGSMADAGGWGAPSFTEVDVMPMPESDASTPEPDTPDEPLITQDAEETVALTPKKEQPKPEKAKPEKKETPQLKPEKTAEELAAEAKARAEAEARARQKAAEEEARKRVTGAFGRGAKMGQGTATGSGKQGNPEGNGSQGAASGVGGYGSFNLGGRSLGQGGLPRPVYNVQDEGRVVVSITVNPKGVVIATSINRQTNTVNPALRKAAEEAARKARFNEVDGVDNQTGTITYNFRLK